MSLDASINSSCSNNTIKSISIVFVACFVLATFLGFPVILPDSRRYLAAAAMLQTSSNAPTLFPFLLRPLYLWVGPWAFVLVNCILGAVLSVLTSNLLYRGSLFISIILSMLVSMVLLCMCFVMMDIQVAFSVLAILLLSAGYQPVLTGIILGLCLVSHNSAILIVTITSILFYVITRNHRFMAQFILILFISLSALSLYNYKFENRLSPLPRHSTQFIVTRLIVDIPEAMDAYVSTYPSSAFTRFWSDFRVKYSAELEQHDDGKLTHPILWGDDGLTLVGKDNVAKESFRFIKFTLLNYLGKYAKSLLVNFIHFFSRNFNYNSIGSDFIFWNGYDFNQYQNLYFPEFKRSSAFGSQALERLHLFFSAPISFFIFIISLVFNFSVVILYALKKVQFKYLYYFSLLNIVFVVSNGFVASNFGAGTSDGRFFVKPFWPCIFNLFLWGEFVLRRRFQGNKKGLPKAHIKR